MMNMKMPHIGRFTAGPLNAITDVAGVTVGHATLDAGNVQTGVTVVRPHQGNVFMQRVPAGVAVINGFGKSVGLVQVEELGVLETPIALTNTFAVPAVSAAQIRQCVKDNPACGRDLPTVNPLVLECNDGYLNDIQQMAVSEAHYLEAYALAQSSFAQGAVGAGRGMSCFKLKGGIGSSSREVAVSASKRYRVGALVLANFGQLANLTVAGCAVGKDLAALPYTESHGADKGSIILLVATDAPLDARQLHRLAVRAGAGLARTGSFYGHGSGDIALAFSTAYTLPQDVLNDLYEVALLHDNLLNDVFEAVADSIEQAILSALWHAQTLTGRQGHQRLSLLDALAGLPLEKRPHWC